MTNASRGYVDLLTNGKLFPSWISKNFKQFQLPHVQIDESIDPCNVQIKLELRKYQQFIGQFIGPQSEYNDLLLYHGLGSGKTGTSINIMNLLYAYDHNYNFVILIKASLKEDPWIMELKRWLARTPEQENLPLEQMDIYKSIHFVHYDSPFAQDDFLNVMKRINMAHPIFFIIDEVHNFIRNVYSNMKSKEGKRAQIIYETIMRHKMEYNKLVKIVMISATPGINTPYELALMYNLLRPGLFPDQESEFNRLYLSESNYPILNPIRRNLFIRRILGLTSYYIGATADLYAQQYLHYVNLPMSDYQYGIYRNFEKFEEEVRERARKMTRRNPTATTSQLYRTYTRQACNFVFPQVSSRISGILRPRPNKFRADLKAAENLEKGKDIATKNMEEQQALDQYFDNIRIFLEETTRYFQSIDKSDRAADHTIQQDLQVFKNGFDSVYKGKFIKFYESTDHHSKLFDEMYKCSPKITAIVFTSFVSPGKVMIYTNYVLMEGIDVIKMYFELIGFKKYDAGSEPYRGYCEYHGRVDKKQRKLIKDDFNNPNNIFGEKCKVFILSPSATEGIQLYNIRQEHILEPYWTEVRIDQVIGRGVRQCSHKELPMKDRVVHIYRYKVYKPEQREEDDYTNYTTDQYIEDQAKAKANLIESFLSAMKESAIDCQLFKAHNMTTQNYKCFQFPESTLLSKNVSAAYRDRINEDITYDSGLYASNSIVERIKVIKIQAVYELKNGEMSKPQSYWYHAGNGMVYDFETHYPVGMVRKNNDGTPHKLNVQTYVIDFVIDIPSLGTHNL